MDNTMVKRGIGAVVLAIIAALLLGYLLKDKSRERQEVVEMSLPGTANDKIPSLSDTTENTGPVIADGANDPANSAGDTVKNTGATIIAAAGATTNNAADTVTTSTNQAATTAMGNATKPGFSIRPTAPNEQREIIDNTAGGSTTAASTNTNVAGTATNKNQQNSAPNATKKNTVVASSSGTQKATFKPRLVQERKPRVVASSQGSNRNNTSMKPAKPVNQASTPVTKNEPKSPAPVKSTASKGGYAIQLMATASESRAKKLAKTMKSEGYSSYITRTTRNNKVLFRVRISTGGNRNSALSAQKKMKRRYRKNFFVQNSLVVSN